MLLNISSPQKCWREQKSARQANKIFIPCLGVSQGNNLNVKTNLITREGYLQLQQEHDHLWNVKRPEVTKIVSWAASLGDRSENADYQYNKRLLRQIDRRVRYLRKTEKYFLVHGSK